MLGRVAIRFTAATSVLDSGPRRRQDPDDATVSAHVANAITPHLARTMQFQPHHTDGTERTWRSSGPDRI